MRDILSQLDEIQGDVRGIKATWGRTIMTLDNIKTSLKAGHQKTKDDAYQRGLEDGKRTAVGAAELREKLEYQKGLKDAWECARELFSSMADSDIEKAFPIEWNNGGFHALINLQPQEAIAKLKAYKEKHKADDEIKVRDEVIWTQDGHVAIVVTRVYTVNGIEWCDGVCKDGKVYSILAKNARKTGRHFDIASVLEDMKK